MIDQATLDYIKGSIQSGLALDTIKNNLVAGGWSAAQAGEALGEAKQMLLIAPPPPAPANPFTVPTKKPQKPNPTSPVSALLMVVLLASLLTLVQNGLIDILDKVAPYSRDFNDTQIYRDTPESQYFVAKADYDSKHDASVSTRLLTTAGLVLPFWILTAGFYIALKERFEKYRVLLLPYYLTSGWLLVYLLFNVSKYILDTKTTAGVYIVLLMLIAVLTGVVVAFQKYSHRPQRT